MASFDPVVIVFGSSESISTLNLRLPILFLFAIDEVSLERLVTDDSQRYFIILLDSITDEFVDRLQGNDRVQIIYSQNAILNVSSQCKLRRIVNKQGEQLTFDVTSDIVYFLTVEGQKQEKLEQIPCAQVCYRQARLLKEWAMSFVKAEPCHILLIPLNSSQENLDNACERLQKLCVELGYPSIIIRTLDKYIPLDDAEKPCLIPYAQALFNTEHPHYICGLLKKLSPLRFYLYGNDYFISNEWSNLMINQETQIMEDEDNWCAFLENESIDNDIKWNFGTIFGEKWQVKRIAPMNVTELHENLRFQSALRRAFKTFHHRQIEVTGEIFEWYDKCIQHGHLQLEPKLTIQQEEKIETDTIFAKYPVSYLPIMPSRPLIKSEGISFIWLDELLHYPEDYLHQIIKPSKWYFFDNLLTCVPYIENQVREGKKIFLVVSRSLGHQLYLTSYQLISSNRCVYVYCSQSDSQIDWINNYPQIRGVYHDSIKLGDQIKEDLYPFHLSGNVNNNLQCYFTVTNEINDESSTISLPLIVYNQEHPHDFLSYQHTIDTLLCMPQTIESRDEMFVECRRIFKDDGHVLSQIDLFDRTYQSHTALYWYSRETFLFRTSNQALRSNDINTIFKMKYFLTELYAQLNDLHKQGTLFNPLQGQQTEKVYRGQQMSKTEFEYFQRIQGNIISINTFLSTTKSLEIARSFAEVFINETDRIQVLFCIEINRLSKSIRPYANISDFSMFKDEEEVLFAMGSVFRVQYIDTLNKIDKFPVIYLTLIDRKELQNNNTHF